jgi:4-amino-4-deoxy-L-arabinose transferase-like glycosyltransferase
MMGKGASGQGGVEDRRRTHLSRALAPAGILAITLVYFWGLGSLPLLDPDEGMYAEISRQMLASGDWIVPRFNGVTYVEKPPLMYWLTAATHAVAGPSEFSARFWKVASMLGTIALTSGLGCRLFSSGVGALSGMILATTLEALLFSRITQMDPA